ncbi:glucose-6-phosphate dehydrogenase [Naasia sp. SYSU D00057]|uniref:glucose-6-phosphate dehydrogenase n=1 Tax=Naasia sp. SYSU D00057 TaxID=2817380 RepID=UPI0027DE86D5|nr:glucose-6-phosphate dehydrogenase [Naasia sp. SYSU D00057]
MTDSTTLVLFGASGDLAKRLLLPGLGSLLASGEQRDSALTDGLVLLGSGRHDREVDEWRDQVREALRDGGAGDDDVERIASAANWITADPTEADDLRRILDEVQGRPILYFALPPAVVESAVDALREVELPEDTTLALEKPFGSDGDGAAALNRKLARLVPEERIHRIDHFLGQPTVLNLLGLRFANRLLEPVWNREQIERVEIVYDEELGLEGRADYYDGAGALVDMLQSHLLQVLAVVAMEPPAAIDAIGFRTAVAQVLEATELWSDGPVLPGTDGASRRARYTAGTVGGKDLPSYAEEEGVDPERGTETLAEVAVAVQNRRWAGVPFVLRSGKAIGDPRRQIEVRFRPVPFVPRGLRGAATPNRVTIGIQPETLSIELTMNGEDAPFRLDHGAVSAELPSGSVTEYGEVLRGILGADPTLFVRGDVAERCWRIVEPVLDAWRDGRVPLDEYPAGSTGPESWRG